MDQREEGFPQRGKSRHNGQERTSVKTGARTPGGTFHVECEAAGKAMANTESEGDVITCISEASLCWAYAWSLWAGLERGVMRLMRKGHNEGFIQGIQVRNRMELRKRE